MDATSPTCFVARTPAGCQHRRGACGCQTRRRLPVLALAGILLGLPLWSAGARADTAPAPGSSAASVATATSAPSFDASAWRGAGLERVKTLFRIYLARKPAVAEVDAFVQIAGTPANALATMQQLIGSTGVGGLATSYQTTFAKRVDGFVNGTQLAALGSNASSLRLSGGAPLNPDGDLTQQLTPLVKASSDDPPSCQSSGGLNACFASWLADWIAPGTGAGGAGTGSGAAVPSGTTYRQILDQMAANLGN